MMIPEEKEKKILHLLERSSMSVGEIASRAGVAPQTVKRVRDNRKSRAITRITETRKFLTSPTKKLKKAVICPTCKAKVIVLPCVFCRTRCIVSMQDNDWERKLELERLLGREGDRFVRIARDIIDFDGMRVIHHPLFASLVKQSRAALDQLPASLRERPQ